jgi:hypothetical protein
MLVDANQLPARRFAADDAVAVHLVCAVLPARPSSERPCCRKGLRSFAPERARPPGLPIIKSSASSTANGSLPTSGSAHSTAWPRPSERGWRTKAHVHVVGLYRAHQRQQVVLARRLQLALQFVDCVEMVFNGTLAAACDENHVPDTGRVGFLDGVLDQRLVHHGQHLFGRCLGGGQEARSQACHGETRPCERGVVAWCLLLKNELLALVFRSISD